MVTLHHLRIGRSIFTVWLLEEVGVEYELKVYHRDPATFRAGDDLKAAHPLGKSPVIEDGDLKISESGAITAYILEKYDAGNRFSPPRTNLTAWATYTQWLHYPEGSVFAPMLLKMLSMMSGQPNPLIDAFSSHEAKLHYGYIATQLGDNEFILGEQFTGADFGISYIVSLAKRLRQLDDYPTLDEYLKRNMNRPGFQRAVERAVE